MMENKNPFFSVVIPTYNHGHLIGRCIESVLNQTYSNWEIIVVNNYSSDNTVEVVEHYHDDRIRLINNSNEGVIAVSRNKGIDLAHGDWICLLDSDDWFYPQKLNDVIKYTDEYDVVYHDLDIYSNKGKAWNKKIKGRHLYGNIADDLLMNSNGIPNSSVSVRASIIKSINGFSTDKELIAVEDSDCWIRIAELTQRFKYLDRSLGGYWIGSNTSCSIKQIEREQALVDKHINRLDFNDKKKAYKSLYYRQARVYHKLSLYQQARNRYRDSFSLRNKKAILLYVLALFRISI